MGINMYMKFVSSLEINPSHFFVNEFGQTRMGEFQAIQVHLLTTLGRTRVKASV